jgi:hypothetical protein
VREAEFSDHPEGAVHPLLSKARLPQREGERYQREMELLRKEQEVEKRRRQEAHDR